MNLYRLCPEDEAEAERAGKARFERRRNSKHRWNRPDDNTLEKQIESIGAEIFCARRLGLTWKDSDRPDHEGDIGPGLQVRQTPYLSGHLLLHLEDEDAHTFYQVVGRFPVFAVTGFIIGKDGKLPEFWQERKPGRPCFWVPQSRLQPLPE